MIFGVLGFLFVDIKRSNKKLFTIGVGCITASLGLLMQLAVVEASIGLYVRGAPGYYMPVYPFVIIACTIGLDILYSRFKSNQSKVVIVK